MSGIAGILRSDGRAIPEHWVRWLEVSIAQRGADGAGKFQDSIEIASGRLEIVLLHQQMGASDISQPVVHTKDDLPVAAVVIDGPTDCVSNAQPPITFPKDVPYAAAWWDASDFQLHLIRGGSGQKPLYMLDLGEAGDGIVFCSVPTPLTAIARELELGGAVPVSAVQRYLQLGFVTGEQNLLSPVQSVPVNVDTQPTPTRDPTPILHRLAGSPSPATDLQSLVAQLGQPFADETMLSRLWRYNAQRRKSPTLQHGIDVDMARQRRVRSLARWHGLRSLCPGQATAKDWVKFGITTLDAACPSSMIEEITAHEFETPYIPHRIGSINDQLQEFDAECRTPDCVLRGIDAAAMVANIDVHIDDSNPYRFEPIPLAAWFRSEQGDLGQLAGDVFTSTNAFDNIPIDQSVVAGMFDDHRSGRASHERPLFALLTLSLWLRLEA
jgi:hypothetical protein